MSVCIATRNDGWPIVVAPTEDEAMEYVREETEYNVYDACFFSEDSDGFESLI